jgi:hypothetical protein
MRPLLACLPISALAVMLSANASAQTTLDGRVNRLEQEMRAVQRKVFPEGAGRLVQPELSAPLRWLILRRVCRPLKRS